MSERWHMETLTCADLEEVQRRLPTFLKSISQLDAILIHHQFVADIATLKSLFAPDSPQPALLIGQEIGVPLTIAIEGIFVIVEMPIRTARLRHALIGLLAPTDNDDDSSAETMVPARDIRGMRVLVAEDNPVNQLVIENILRSIGCHVKAVSDGAQALDLVSANRAAWDVLLMDCEMPVMDGYEATRRIRDLEQVRGTTRLPIVGLSAHASDDYVGRARAAGMDEYLSKPVTRDQVLQTLIRLQVPSRKHD
ncbi:MAG: hypothetical protein CVV10_02000 [Gammaproteobacteria bacterium HGW-Gammaproteobacteria-14]|nr:MAG: hypothetical protein CVV10_02000 [Gammaproteobacteria bacterium HGW-Gammaproteobacteria-14]